MNELKQKERKYDLRRLAVGRIISSPTKTNIVETLDSDQGLHATELYEKSGAMSEGTFYYHVRDLEWLGVVENTTEYRLTEFGKEIAKALSKLK